MEEFAATLTPGNAFIVQGKRPHNAVGVGLVAVVRGALGLWLRIASYQIIAPTTWTFSPRTAAGTPALLEQAWQGAEEGEGASELLTVQHIVRGLDRCKVYTLY